MAKLKLSLPWYEYYEKVKALFGNDPDVQLIFDEEKMTLSIYVDSQLKADSLAQIFPIEKEWGDTKLLINVIPCNADLTVVVKYHMSNELPIHKVMYYALCDNPHFVEVLHTDSIFDMTYVVFKNEVIQYYNDNLGDPNGLVSTLAQDIAKEIFDVPVGVFFCTES